MQSKIRPVILIILIAAISISSACMKSYPNGFSTNVGESQKKSEQTSEIDYSKYLRIICYPIELVTKQPNQVEGFAFNQIRFTIRIENITDQDISFDCQIFADSSFSENFIESNNAKLCSNLGVFPLEAGKGNTIEGIYSFRDPASLNAEELALYNKTKDIFCCEFLIDGKWAFVKFDSSSGIQAE